MKKTILIFALAVPLGMPLAAQEASLDFGYRFVETHGNQDAYRSVLNLGEGPKLFGLDLSFGKNKYLDQFDIHMANLGGDPYSTIRVEARKDKLFRLSWQYRDIAYFNHLDSFALGRDWSDMHRRLSDLDIEFRPGSKVIPFFGWSHDNGTGSGVSDFVVDTNEYPIAGTSKDRTDLFRGGVRFEYRKWHGILEQGGTIYKQDDVQVDANKLTGDLTKPYLGQPLFITGANQSYNFTGNTIFNKAVVVGNPYSWMDVSGQFLYSRPAVDGNYSGSATGNFILLDLLVFHNSIGGTAMLQAKQPHVSGDFSVEVRPMKRVRIVQNWFTDRLHDASSLFTTGTLPVSVSSYALDRLAWNYSQEQVEGFVDVTNKLTVRGGYRYLWGDAGIRQQQATPGAPSGDLRMNVGLAGFTYRFTKKFYVNADYEGSPGDKSYFRTSLQNYNRSRVRATWRPVDSVSLTLNSQILENRNPNPQGAYEFSSRATAVAISWTPPAAKKFSFNGSYTRAAIRSEIPYLIPQQWVYALSLYRENAHLLNGYGEFAWHGARFSAGGAMYLSSGSRPTDFYQPYVKVLVTMRKHLTWKGEWRWNGLAAAEGFGSNLAVISLVLNRSAN